MSGFERPNCNRTTQQKTTMHPPRIRSALGSDRMLGKAESPNPGNYEEHGERSKEPTSPEKTRYSQQQQKSPYNANGMGFAHPKLCLVWSSDVPICRNQEKHGDTVGKNRTRCHHRIVLDRTRTGVSSARCDQNGSRVAVSAKG